MRDVIDIDHETPDEAAGAQYLAEPAAYQTVQRQRSIAEAHYLRAAALSAAMRPVVGWVSRLLREWVLMPLVRCVQRGQLTRELAELDDRLLADIGIRRGEIQTIVARVYPRTAEASKTPAKAATVHHLMAGKDVTADYGHGDHKDHSLAA